MAQTSTLPARGLLCLALASAMCACMAAEGDASVVTMTTSNFDSLIKEGSWLVKFYAVRAPLRVWIAVLRVLMRMFVTAVVRSLQAPGPHL